MFGFELAESMAGHWHSFEEALVDRPLRIQLRLFADGLRRFVKTRTILAEGTIDAEGLATGRSVTGEVRWRLLDENRVPYALRFEGDDGRTYHLRGQRDFFMYNAIGSLTTMTASLYDAVEREVGRAVVDFEPKMELPALVKSFRPKLFPRHRG